MRLNAVLLSGAIGSVLACAALAQAATNYTSIEVPAGKPVQLTYHASANKNCTPAMPPTVRITQPPKDGVLTVRKAVLTTDKIAGCPRLKTPVQVVFYQAHADYAGPDHVGYEVMDSNERPVRTASAMQVRRPVYMRSVGRRHQYEAFLAPLLAELYP